MHAICKDQPQLFWLDESFQYSYRQGLSGSEKVTEISADFNSLADDLETNRSAVENQKDVLAAAICMTCLPGNRKNMFMTGWLLFDYLFPGRAAITRHSTAPCVSRRRYVQAMPKHFSI